MGGVVAQEVIVLNIKRFECAEHLLACLWVRFMGPLLDAWEFGLVGGGVMKN